MALVEIIKDGEEVLADLPDHLRIKVHAADNLEKWIDSQQKRTTDMLQELQHLHQRILDDMEMYATSCASLQKEIVGYMRESYNSKEECVILRKSQNGKIVIVRRSRKDVEAEIGKSLMNLLSVILKKGQ